MSPHLFLKAASVLALLFSAVLTPPARADVALAYNGEDFLQAPDRSEWEAGGLYEGRFDDGTTFQIALAYPEPRTIPPTAAHLFSQAVWTPRHYAGTPSTLLAVSASASAEVSEITRLAVATAKGIASDETCAVTLSPDRTSGHGIWSGPGTAAPRSFTLRRSVRYVGIVVTRPASADLAAFSDYYREHGFTFSSVFPVLGDHDADAWIRDKAGECRDTGDCANAVRIVWRSSSLVSLDAMVWGSSGGAHGVGYTETRQYGIRDGVMTPRELADFIDPGADCRHQVAAAIDARLEQRGMHLYLPGDGDAAADVNLLRGRKFTPTPDGIAFHFDSYEAGSYAQGAPNVFVPRGEMTACVQHLPGAD
ncbi:MAG: RsiV family protein [Pseudomonadota bacterium]|nr:RsiV family protein [Pseudomonadota bacterium]